MTEPAPHLPEPIFVGGSARSGTHAMGGLLDAHPKYNLIRLEVRMHAAASGVSELLTGDASMDKFMKKALGFWWERGMHNTRGLKRIVARDELEAALGDFRQAYERDPMGASRELIRRLLDPVAHKAGKPYWVEVTGKNIHSSPMLSQLFPNAKFIHMFRDGRAVVASILNKPSMTNDPMIALRHWNGRVRNADAALRRMPPGKVLTMRLEDLVHDDREGSYSRLIEFLGIPDDEPIRDHFDSRISPQAAHIGQWRARISEYDARRVERVYARILRDLHRDGVTWVPTPEEAGLPAPRLSVPAPLRRWDIQRPFTPLALRRTARRRVRDAMPRRVRRGLKRVRRATPRPVRRAARWTRRRVARPVHATVRAGRRRLARRPLSRATGAGARRGS